MFSGHKILITGATGQVARPVAESLAADNEVWCLGRFADIDVERELIACGVRTWPWDMGRDGLDGLPDDFTHVMHAAAYRGNGSDFDAAVEINSVAAGRLMAHCRHAEAFLFVSTGAVYTGEQRDHRQAETDALGGRAPWPPTHPVGKIAAEGAVRAFAATLGLPTTIARLNVAYGPHGHGGMPVRLFRRMLAGQPIEVPRDGKNWCNPIHADDIARQVPLLWGVAAIPPRVVNWGGDEAIGIGEMVAYLAEITGVLPRFAPSEVMRETNAFDNVRRRALIGDCEVHWHDGVRRTLAAHFPGMVRGSTARDFAEGDFSEGDFSEGDFFRRDFLEDDLSEYDLSEHEFLEGAGPSARCVLRPVRSLPHRDPHDITEPSRCSPPR